MLALDFDGVVCDALAECAAVTWHAAHVERGSEPPALGDAVAQLPPTFMRTFRSVRAYSRTLDDFMVATTVAAGLELDQAGFDQHRAAAGPAQLAVLAAQGEAIRAHWRTTEYAPWVALHTVYAEVAHLIEATEQPVVIVSAKDADSILAILAHHGLAQYVEDVYGSCQDKRAVLTELAGRNETTGLTFVDDNLGNAIAAEPLVGVRPFWARWGYHGPEDVHRAELLGFPTVALHQLDTLIAAPAHSELITDRRR